MIPKAMLIRNLSPPTLIALMEYPHSECLGQRDFARNNKSEACEGLLEVCSILHQISLLPEISNNSDIQID